jgi:putative phosphoribosyl transferase
VSYRFQNRAEAGRFLAQQLQPFAGQRDVVALGLPRGGIPVAFEVARKLRVPLHAFVVRKLGVPKHEELAMGAVASGGICVFNQSVIKTLGISQDSMDEVMARERRELERREQIFRTGAAPNLSGQTVILIDDGLATGATMRAAVMAVRSQRPARIVVATPVAADETCRLLEDEGTEVVCVQRLKHLDGVGQWYEDFSQTTDEEVWDLLDQASRMPLSAS